MVLRIPSIEEMAMMAMNGHPAMPIWTPRELQGLSHARNALRAIPMSSPSSAVFDALHSCVPFACGLLDSFRVSRPFEPIDVLHHMPESFIADVANYIEMDPSPLVLQRLPMGFVCRAIDYISPHLWQNWHVAQALYPHHGINFPSILTLSSVPRGYDRELSTLWLFHEHDQRPLSDRELRMVEALHGDILAAVERLRLPFIPRDSLREQMLREQDAGYALFRANDELIECNRRALALARRHAAQQISNDPRAPLSALFRWARATPSPSGYSTKFAATNDEKCLLEVALHSIAKEQHALSEDVTLVVLREIPMALTPIATNKQPLLQSLPPRRRQVATFLINSGLSFKEIAHEMHVSEGTLRKHAEHLYRTLGVRSRAELGALFK